MPTTFSDQQVSDLIDKVDAVKEAHAARVESLQSKVDAAAKLAEAKAESTAADRDEEAKEEAEDAAGKSLQDLIDGLRNPQPGAGPNADAGGTTGTDSPAPPVSISDGLSLVPTGRDAPAA